MPSKAKPQPHPKKAEHLMKKGLPAKTAERIARETRRTKRG